MPTREQAQRGASEEGPATAEGRPENGRRRKPARSAGADESSSPDVTRRPRYLPALLRPFRQSAGVRWDYPIFLSPLAESTGGEDAADLSPLDLSNLPDLLAALLPEAPEARILRDNILRLERAVRELMAGSADDGVPRQALPLLRQAAQRMSSELELGAEDAATLQSDVDAFLAQVPEGSLFEPLSEITPLHLLLRSAARRFGPRRQAFVARANDLAAKLRAILEIDHGKRPEGRSPEAIRGAMGAFGGRFIDSAALAQALGPQRGSAPLDSEHRREIEAAAQTLESLNDSVPETTLVISDAPLRGLADQAAGEIQALVVADPCQEAGTRFEKIAAEAANVVRAARLAEWVIENSYDPKRDQTLLARLDWRSFRPEELALIPPVIACTSASAILSRGLLSLSRLLLSGMPIQILMTLDPAHDPASESSGESADFTGFRFEPAYLALAHRQAFVQQTSAVRPAHMNAGFDRAVELPRAALHVIATLPEMVPHSFSPWIAAQAAIEGRAHPLFRYDPTAGASWARRFTLDGNPQSDLSWPAYPADWQTSKDEEPGDVAFTFADFALLDPLLSRELGPLATELEGVAAVPLANWLELDPEEERGSVPFIWATDGEEGTPPLRLALSRSLALACRDRLAFWRTLQELGGVHSEYVEQAVERARGEAHAEAESRIEELQKQHAEELEALRTSAAEELVDNLIGGLLAADAASLAAMPTRPSDRATSAQIPVPPAAEPADGGTSEGAEMPATATVLEPPVLEQEESLEPYIDTELCTTCNDCINLNPLMFAYNADKKAYIKDLRAGTFQQLVLAAEKCPARIIHPGSPVNPDEPDLDKWIQRAARFN